VERPTALVVDDEPSVCRLLEVVLGAEFDVTTRLDGRAAAEYLKTNTPDLIVLDVNMPHLSGIELCGKLKRMTRFAHTPVIILTAQGDDRTEDYAKMSKADVFAHKPLQGKNFLELAKRLVAGEQEKVMQLLKQTRF
jgi:two-component system, chemotaxis family, chemotaxis protein CheY